MSVKSKLQVSRDLAAAAALAAPPPEAAAAAAAAAAALARPLLMDGVAMELFYRVLHSVSFVLSLIDFLAILHESPCNE